MKIPMLAIAAAMSVLLTGGLAFAQATAPAPSAHSAAWTECWKKADAKGLHLTARKKFHADCMKTAASEPK